MTDDPRNIAAAAVAGIRDTARTAAAQQPACGCGDPATPNVVHRPSAPCYADESAAGDADRIVAYRSRGGRVLRCLAHVPDPRLIGTDLHPVTAEDLPDGGLCTYPTAISQACGTDVLIPQPAPAAGQPAAQQQIDRATILREAANEIERMCPDSGAAVTYDLCQCEAATLLRRMADEAAQ